MGPGADDKALRTNKLGQDVVTKHQSAPVSRLSKLSTLSLRVEVCPCLSLPHLYIPRITMERNDDKWDMALKETRKILTPMRLAAVHPHANPTPSHLHARTSTSTLQQAFLLHLCILHTPPGVLENGAHLLMNESYCGQRLDPSSSHMQVPAVVSSVTLSRPA